MLAMTRLIFTAALALATCSSIICGAACDFVQPGECLGEAGMFGPCTANSQCSPGMLCMAATQGSICTPDFETFRGPRADSCAPWEGLVAVTCSDEWLLCYLPCSNDAGCIGGMVCAEDWEMCVHPIHDDDVRPPAGETLGPCSEVFDDGCAELGAICLEEKAGSLCVQKDHPAWLITCSQDSDCVNGMACGTQSGYCVWP